MVGGMGNGKARLAALIVLVGGLALAPAAHAATARPEPLRLTRALGTYDDVAGARLLATQINSDRVANGLPPLAISTKLTAIAQDHSRRMAEAGKIWHNDDLFGQTTRSALGAIRLGENVGFDGGGAVTSHQMYMSSPAHRANILDPRFTAMGIAVTVADGIAYSTEDFMQAGAAPPPPPPPPPPAAPTPAAPPTTAPVVAQAAKPTAAPTHRRAPAVPTRTATSADTSANQREHEQAAPVVADASWPPSVALRARPVAPAVRGRCTAVWIPTTAVCTAASTSMAAVRATRAPAGTPCCRNAPPPAYARGAPRPPERRPWPIHAPPAAASTGLWPRDPRSESAVRAWPTLYRLSARHTAAFSDGRPSPALLAVAHPRVWAIG
jgi:hypothetical protein